MDTKFGTTQQFGTARSTTERLTGRDSLISSWQSSAAGRVFYESQASKALENKLTSENLGPKLFPYLKAGDREDTGCCSKQLLLEAGDREDTGCCSKQLLLEVCLLHFGVLLTTAEQKCLIAEWQVMDHLTGDVDYKAPCKMATTGYATTNNNYNINNNTSDSNFPASHNYCYFPASYYYYYYYLQASHNYCYFLASSSYYCFPAPHNYCYFLAPYYFVH
eukprot:gene577-1993_t